MAWPTNPRPAKSLIVLRDQYNKKYPKRNKESDGMIADEAHATRVSDHNPDKNGVVKALDITHDPDDGVDCTKESEILVRLNAQRINYLIWNRRIWQAGWKEYKGANPHDEHMHISVNETNQDDTSPWNIEEDDMYKGHTAEELYNKWQDARPFKDGVVASKAWSGDMNQNVSKIPVIIDDTYQFKADALKSAQTVSEDAALGREFRELIKKSGIKE